MSNISETMKAFLQSSSSGTANTAGQPSQTWNPPVSQTITTTGGTNFSPGYNSPLAGQYYGYNTLGQLSQTYQSTPIVPPTLPIKLGMRELVKLAQVMDTDPELHEIIKKFQPWIGVEI